MSNTYLPLDTALDPVASRFFRRIPEFVNWRLPERLNRDEVRTPMQWNSEPNAGFTSPVAVAWLPVHPGYRDRNVAVQDGVEGSMLELYRLLLRIRSERPSLHRGSLRLRPVDPSNPEVLTYERIDHLTGAGAGSPEVTMITVNFASSAAWIEPGGRVELLVATDPSVVVTGGRLHLPPCSAVVVAVMERTSTWP